MPLFEYMGLYQARRKSRKLYERSEPDNDYLKYMKVVRYWAMAKYDISPSHIDMLLYLYSEGLFTKDKFADYRKLMAWGESTFYDLFNEGWITKWRKQNPRLHESALFEVSYKGKKMVNSIYRKLNGEEKISQDPRYNPIFDDAVANSTDKIYRRAIRYFNGDMKYNSKI